MALISRVTRLFRADLHAVLDRIEEPALLLRQAVRDMEEDIFESEQRLRLQQHESEQLQQRHNELQASVARLEEELDICFDSGKNDLAKILIKRKLEAERALGLLARKRESLMDSVDKLHSKLEENRLRLTAMQQKADLLASQSATETAEDGWYHNSSYDDISVRDEDVEIAFLREQQKRSKS